MKRAFQFLEDLLFAVEMQRLPPDRAADDIGHDIDTPEMLDRPGDEFGRTGETADIR